MQRGAVVKLPLQTVDQYTWNGDKMSLSKATLLLKDSIMYKTYKKFFIGVPER